VRQRLRSMAVMVYVFVFDRGGGSVEQSTGERAECDM
jgi:hypothetical protein